MKWSAAILAISLPLSASCQEPDAEAEAKLAANGLVILDYPLKQGFSAYINSRHPNFVTSDSLLMAYHRLFEEFVSRQSIDEMAAHLRLWPELWKNLPAKPATTEPTEIEGHRRSRLLVGTAHRLLLGELPDGLSQEERSAITEEVARVEKGEGDRAPDWLQSTKKAPVFVPYQSFLPASFGDGVRLLERYYRCRKWLQEMKLDTSDASICAMLEQVLMASQDLDRDVTSPFEEREPTSIVGLMPSLRRFWGPDEEDADALAESRDDLRTTLKDSASWTMVTPAIPIGSEQARELLRLGDASRLPEVVGAALGSPLAPLLINGPQRAVAKKPLDGGRDEELYVDALQILNQEIDPRAPAIMRSEAWKRKQLNATLGSWTEYRYALQLASREDAVLLGISDEEAGFVEPVPAFYRCLGEQVEYLSRKLSEQRAPGISHTNGLAVRLTKMAAALGNAGNQNEGERPARHLALTNAELLTRLFPQAGGKGRPLEAWEWDNPHLIEEVARLIPPLVARYWKGEKAAVETLRDAAWRQPDDLATNLGLLAAMCLRLDAIAERQLAGQPQSSHDSFYIRNIGMYLAEVMFYKENSYLSPLDDAPRIVRYATLAELDRIRINQAATARPKLMLIRYPDHTGKEILCQGAVYAFRNLERDHSLTMSEWRTESEKEPWPSWMSPITGKAKPEKQKR